ncbi:hypothetical protein HOP50_02g15800 [Chloropicon primus]|uniref:Uncharacterized protein n=1 Tax=Chloropicon primus TaxID=1764295 RepID=A0A5B8MFI0_9CHLO|nr:hypothetical protein A3770_02p15890 [Chloropicon primus]UPQ98280.1 hypothetical protein HOP50_02g15800 [Chloropicon primus]|eukprot:QDZ19071.1 hypothetical protein A3770_02p15890 [Chloropicon primus]
MASAAGGGGLGPKKKALLKALAVLLGALLVTSGCGLFVLMDYEEKQYRITNSDFGRFWLAINKGNPVLQPLTFNFAIIGLFMIYQQFYPRSRPAAERKTK